MLSGQYLLKPLPTLIAVDGDPEASTNLLFARLQRVTTKRSLTSTFDTRFGWNKKADCKPVQMKEFAVLNIAGGAVLHRRSLRKTVIDPGYFNGFFCCS